MKHYQFAALLVAAVTFFPSSSSAIVAATLEDICAPDADPCVIAGRVEVPSSLPLDFGLRSLRIAAGGKLVVGYQSIKCGGLVIEEGGRLDVSNRFDKDGYATVYMDVNGRCAATPTMACQDSGDCGGGECSGGDLVISGRVRSRFEEASTIRAYVAGDVLVDGRLELSTARGGQGGGGWFELYVGGSIDFLGRLRSRGTGIEDGGGGRITFEAGGDVRMVDALFDLDGPLSDGGWLTVEAGNDAFFSGDFRASSLSGPGWGGYFTITAGRDITIESRSDGDETSLAMNGHRAKGGEFADYAGDGGEIYLTAERDLRIGSGVTFEAKGGKSEALGGLMEVWAGGSLEMNSTVDLSTEGPEGEGGEARIESFGAITLGPQSSIRADGAYTAGSVAIDADGPLEVGGSISIASKKGGEAGSIDLSSDSDVIVSGTLRVLGPPDAFYSPEDRISVRGCDVSFVGGALAELVTNTDAIWILAREAMLVDAGSSLLAPGTASTIAIIYRDPLQPPSLLGNVAPAPTLELDETLLACP